MAGDPHDIPSRMECDADSEYEHGSAYWIRKQHRKVDPDLEHELSLPYDDSKPAHEKVFAE